MRVVDLKALMKECGLRGYSKLSKVKLIELLRNNPPPTATPAPTLQPIPPPPTQHPTRSPPPPPPSQASPSVRFRPNRPRKPELLWQLEERHPRQPQPAGPEQVHPPAPPTLRPYHLKPKRGQETFIEPTSSECKTDQTYEKS